MKSFLFATSPARSATGMLALRIVTGFIFLMHGYQKVFGMGWSGVQGAFGQMGAPLPGLTGPLFGGCELLFGITMILGLISRISAAWFILDMLGAITVVHIKNGWSGPGGMEFPVLLLAASLALFFAGPGAVAADAAIANRATSNV
jgi:Predicted membrane protein